MNPGHARPPFARLRWLALLLALGACATQRGLDDGVVQRLARAAVAEAERCLAIDGHVKRFTVLVDVDDTVDFGGVDGGGNDPAPDLLQCMLERAAFDLGADVTFPGEGRNPTVDTVLVLCCDRLGHRREVRVPLSRPAVRSDNSDR